MNIVEAEKNFMALVNKVHTEGITVDLESDNRVIARLTPAEARPKITVGGFQAFMRTLPSLGDDADEFAKDIEAIRNDIPIEANPWG